MIIIYDIDGMFLMFSFAYAWHNDILLDLTLKSHITFSTFDIFLRLVSRMRLGLPLRRRASHKYEYLLNYTQLLLPGITAQADATSR